MAKHRVPRRYRITALAAAGTVLAVVAALLGITSPALAASSAGDGAFTYTGSWNLGNPNGATEHWSPSVGATATAQVDVATGGGSVSVKGVSWSANGFAKVTVDSATPVYADTYGNNGCCAERNWFTTPALTAGRHTVVVAVTSLKNRASAGTAISITGISTSNGAVVAATPPPPPAPTPTPTAGPAGVPGTWRLAFEDTFDGTSINTAKWNTNWYGEGHAVGSGLLPDYSANVTVAGGNLQLTPTQTGGALVNTDFTGGARETVGSCAEARVSIPGNGTTIYNWPAWWATPTDADGWPSSGEHDIAEGLGTLTVNYHSPSGSHNQGTVPGVWSNAFHTYTLCRHATSADVYWDGQVVKHYATDDNGGPEMLVLDTGSTKPDVAGTAARVLVDYVRVWAPA